MSIFGQYQKKLSDDVHYWLIWKILIDISLNLILNPSFLGKMNWIIFFIFIFLGQWKYYVSRQRRMRTPACEKECKYEVYTQRVRITHPSCIKLANLSSINQLKCFINSRCYIHLSWSYYEVIYLRSSSFSITLDLAVATRSEFIIRWAWVRSSQVLSLIQDLS